PSRKVKALFSVSSSTRWPHLRASRHTRAHDLGHPVRPFKPENTECPPFEALQRLFGVGRRHTTHDPVVHGLEPTRLTPVTRALAVVTLTGLLGGCRSGRAAADACAYPSVGTDGDTVAVAVAGGSWATPPPCPMPTPPCPSPTPTPTPPPPPPPPPPPKPTPT